MKIYYDADCKVCNKYKNFVLKRTDSEMEFIDINNSDFQDLTKKTIVVFENNEKYKYGNAMKIVLLKMKYPYKLLSYLPSFILTFFYIILRDTRKYIS